MKTTTQWLDEAKRVNGWESDYRLAKELGVSVSRLSNWRRNRKTFNDEVAINLAKMVNRDPAELIASAHAERTTEPAVKAVYQRIAELARVAATVCIVGSFTLSPALPELFKGCILC